MSTITCLFLRQAKAAGGSAYSTLAQLNSADRWLISPDGEDVINQAGAHYSGASRRLPAQGRQDYRGAARRCRNASDQGARLIDHVFPVRRDQPAVRAY